MRATLALLLALGLLFGFVRETLLTLAENRRPERKVYIAQDKLNRLMRYHGTIALKIEHGNISIWRDQRWILVQRRED